MDLVAGIAYAVQSHGAEALDMRLIESASASPGPDGRSRQN